MIFFANEPNKNDANTNEKKQESKASELLFMGFVSQFLFL